MSAGKDDKFLNTLEKAVSDILGDPKAKVGDRLKAIEMGAKVAAIRHRIDGGGEGEDGNFFAKRG